MSKALRGRSEPRVWVSPGRAWGRGCCGSLGPLLPDVPSGWRMPSMRAVLEARQRAAAVLMEDLGAELERVRQALTDEAPTTARSCRRASSSRWWTVTPDGTGVAARAQTFSRPARVRVLSPAGPDQDGGQVQCGLVGDSKLVRPHGKALPLLDPSDVPLEGIALFVCLSIEAGRAASGAASPQTVADLVGGLWDNGTDAASTEVPTDRAGGVALGRRPRRAATAGASAPGLRHVPPSSAHRLDQHPRALRSR